MSIRMDLWEFLCEGRKRLTETLERLEGKTSEMVLVVLRYPLGVGDSGGKPMTRDEILAIKEGEGYKLHDLVGTRVLGWSMEQLRNPLVVEEWHPSSNAADAFQVETRIQQLGLQDEYVMWLSRLIEEDPTGSNLEYGNQFTRLELFRIAHASPLLRCKAALLAVAEGGVPVMVTHEQRIVELEKRISELEREVERADRRASASYAAKSAAEDVRQVMTIGAVQAIEALHAAEARISAYEAGIMSWNDLMERQNSSQQYDQVQKDLLKKVATWLDGAIAAALKEVLMAKCAKKGG